MSFKPNSRQFTGVWNLESVENMDKVLALLGFSSIMQRIISYTTEKFHILFHEYKKNDKILRKFNKVVSIECSNYLVSSLIQQLGFKKVQYSHDLKLKKFQLWPDDEKRFGPVRSFSSFDKKTEIFTLIWQWPEPDENGVFPKKMSECKFIDDYMSSTRWLKVDHSVLNNKLIIVLQPHVKTREGVKTSVIGTKTYRRGVIPTNVQNNLDLWNQKCTLK